MHQNPTTFSRREMIMRAAVVTGCGAVAAAFGPVLALAQTAQVDQKAVLYQTTPKDKAQCSGCGSFLAPASCKLVSGTITPSGWCTLYNVKAPDSKP